jgi:hypothetical protein
MQATGTQTLQRSSASPRRVLIAALVVVAIAAILGSYAILRTDASTPTRTFPQVSVEPGRHQPATLIHEISMRPTNGN